MYQEPSPKKNRLKLILLIVGGVFVVSCALCSVLVYAVSTSHTTNAAPTATTVPTRAAIIATATSTHAPTTAPTTKPTAKPTARPQPKPISQQVSEIVSNAGLLGQAKTNYQSDGSVTITDNIGDGNLTNSLTVGEIKLECFNAQKTLWTSGINSHLSDVTLNVTMNVIDQYGNQSNSQVAYCDLTQATASKFNWSNLDQDSAWQVYDNTDIAPFLTK